MEQEKELIGMIKNYLMNRVEIKEHIAETIGLLKRELEEATKGTKEKDTAILSAALPVMDLREVGGKASGKTNDATYHALVRYEAMLADDLRMKQELLEYYYDQQMFYRQVDNGLYCLDFKRKKAIDLILIKNMTKETGKRELRCGHEALQTLICEGILFLLNQTDARLRGRMKEMCADPRFVITQREEGEES